MNARGDGCHPEEVVVAVAMKEVLVVLEQEG